MCERLTLTDYSDEELKAETQRRKDAKKVKLGPEAELRKRVNALIKNPSTDEVDAELLGLLTDLETHEDVVQRVYRWALKAKSEMVAKEAIRLYRGFSDSRFLASGFGNDHTPDALNAILFLLQMDEEAGKKQLGYILYYLFVNELDFLKLKKSGGMYSPDRNSESYFVGYDRDRHRANRNAINVVLMMAKDGDKYSRFVRKCILEFFRTIQSNKNGFFEAEDLKRAMAFGRWEGAPWK